MNMPAEKNNHIHQGFYNFVNEDVLPMTSLNAVQFWSDFEQLIADLAPRNRQLLSIRQEMQSAIDEYHHQHQGECFNAEAYEAFLRSIGYLVEEGKSFCVSTTHVDHEIASIAGPQLVVPIANERFALNAANARWGSMYDALYGTNVIPHTKGLKPCKLYNEARGKAVIEHARDYLDRVFPLESGSHHNVSNYMVYYKHMLACFPDGTHSGLKTPCQFVALTGHKEEPTSIVLRNNGLHAEIIINRQGKIGEHDIAGVDDIMIESALTTIMDFEDSVSTVDADDKIHAYKNWLGLMRGDLRATFEKDGSTHIRCMNKDRFYTDKNGEEYRVHGRALLLARNVGHLMTTELMLDSQGSLAPEGIVDAVITGLIGSLDLQQDTTHKAIRNSRSGSIYIVKPKMHGPDEVAFTCELFNRVEDMLGLERNTMKIGIMDEERRTTVNLKECIRMAKDRLVFINTGFLDRTGDEIHTSMHAGPFLPKAQIKEQPWISAYENWNVDIGLECGLPGHAQIGKGMWAMPDEMAQMMETKIDHPRAGANTAWVPSPTAATLHALHYHDVDVQAVQNRLKQRSRASLTDILTIPLLPAEGRHSLTNEQIERELENNIQGILGYVVRWVEMGVGCSKVPDINHIGLMEDRATLRISSQHIANWLNHHICNDMQVLEIMERMAHVVDAQNKGISGYVAMTPNTDQSLAFQAAKDLIFEGKSQPSGYTEPLLHHYRQLAKNR
ncbi:malate synthase G [Echinimonas agarilytica]|uniref:Malate synthase G n=1 Tax=Echinimonas agarilytica TaxID=1215918 RepID=A0AA41W9Z1_9GAMM|nr:malate synthase G [Echinimonas agarilytica]MCM2680781.1 malate synthase G [Echinimonas agarilytica]